MDRYDHIIRLVGEKRTIFDDVIGKKANWLKRYIWRVAMPISNWQNSKYCSIKLVLVVASKIWCYVTKKNTRRLHEYESHKIIYPACTEAGSSLVKRTEVDSDRLLIRTMQHFTYFVFNHILIIYYLLYQLTGINTILVNTRWGYKYNSCFVFAIRTRNL